jgi:predicted ATPase
MSSLGSQPTLLVIDNAEQVAEATAWLVEQLADAPNLEILITSRIPLGLRGEHLWSVPPLVPAASRQLLRERSSIPLTDEQTALVVDVADGLPLAVELLASSLDAVGPSAVISRLDQLPALLQRGGGDRHASIGAAIDSSYRALPVNEQRVFRQMSVFPGGFTAATAKHVTNGEVDAPVALARLVAASLLPRAAGDRFRMLEPIRQFAEEKLAAEGEEGDAIARMIAWARQFTRTMSKRAFDQRHPDWRRTIAAELAVIDRAFDEAASRGDIESAQAIAAAMCPFHQSTNAAAGYRRAVAALALTERDTRSTAALLLGAGQLAVAFSRDDAIRLLDDARRRLESQGSATGVATAWHYRAIATRDLTDCENAVAAADVCGLVPLRGHTRINHAISLAIHGRDPDLSLRDYDEAERIGREHGSDHVIANSKKGRAGLLLRMGAPAERIIPHLEWAERVFAAEGDQWVLVDCHAFTAELLIRDGEFDEALVPVEACLAMTVDTLDDATSAPWCLLLAAALLRHRGDVDAANAAAHAAAGHPYGVERSLELAVTELQARELGAAGPAPRIDLDLADLHEAAAAALEALKRPTG